MPITDPAPIACTLTPGVFKDRVGWIRGLSAGSLRGHQRDGLVLRLTYEPDVAAEVRKLVEQERTCCGFLRFKLEESDAAVYLTITAPLEAGEASAELFAHFVPS